MVWTGLDLRVADEERKGRKEHGNYSSGGFGFRVL